MTETQTYINKVANNINRLATKQVFDPRIIDNANRRVWTSESVNLAYNGIKSGYKLTEYPYLKSVKSHLLRKANLTYKYTEEEQEIFNLILDDKEFFCDNFAKLKDAEKGWTKIKLRDYQRKLMKQYDDHNHNIIMFPRQSGKTTTTILEIIYFAITNFDKDIVVIAQSDLVVKEIIQKIKEAFSALPFFMQPGFVSFRNDGFILDNGCRLIAGIASESVVQGYSLDFLFIDEFAYIANSRVRKFWTNIYPTLSNNPNSKCIIASTPNGRNMFYELWTEALKNLNGFKTCHIRWYEVPGRGEEFKRQTIAAMGIEGWEMGYECSFDTQLKSIFNSPTQKKLRELQTKNINQWSLNNDAIGNKYGIEFIDKKLISYDVKKDYFLFGIDLAEGLGQDSSVLKIKKVCWNVDLKRLEYKTIGIYKSNTISVEDFAEHCMRIFSEFNADKIKAIVETNNYGGEYFATVKSLKFYENDYANFPMDIFAMFKRASKNDYEYGIRWNSHNKRLAVKSFSNFISKDVFTETHNDSIEEYLNFGKQKNDTYSAQYGHDDLVMSDVSISYYLRTKTQYSATYLKEAEETIREEMQDVDVEILEMRRQAEREKTNIFNYNGFEQRNHTKEVLKLQNDDLMM